VKSPRPRAAVLLSGAGRSLENLARLARAGDLACDLGLVISNRAEAPGLERARRFELPAEVIDPGGELDGEEFSARVFRAVEAAHCELVVLAGFLRFLPIPPPWARRVLNIHPSLLPAFGGQGYYGRRVHAAVLERGVQFSGCTVHYVDNEYDHGPILLQRCIPVHAQDDVSSLAARVFEEEKLALPAAIALHFAASNP